MASRHEPALVARYREVAERVRAAIEEHLWSEEHGRYLRSRWVGRSDEGGEKPPAMFDRPLRYPTRAVRSVDREDARVDSSLLGLSLAVPCRRSRVAADAGDDRGGRA